jgi:hypothetical protein
MHEAAPKVDGNALLGMGESRAGDRQQSQYNEASQPLITLSHRY